MLKLNLQLFGGRGSAGGNSKASAESRAEAKTETEFGHKFGFGSKEKLEKGKTYTVDTNTGKKQLEYLGRENLGASNAPSWYHHFQSTGGNEYLTDTEVYRKVDYAKTVGAKEEAEKRSEKSKKIADNMRKRK